MSVEDKYIKDEKRCELFSVGCAFENKLFIQFMHTNLKFKKFLGEITWNYFLSISEGETFWKSE